MNAELVTVIVEVVLVMGIDMKPPVPNSALLELDITETKVASTFAVAPSMSKTPPLPAGPVVPAVLLPKVVVDIERVTDNGALI